MLGSGGDQVHCTVQHSIVPSPPGGGGSVVHSVLRFDFVSTVGPPPKESTHSAYPLILHCFKSVTYPAPALYTWQVACTGQFFWWGNKWVHKCNFQYWFVSIIIGVMGTSITITKMFGHSWALAFLHICCWFVIFKSVWYLLCTSNVLHSTWTALQKIYKPLQGRFLSCQAMSVQTMDCKIFSPPVWVNFTGIFSVGTHVTFSKLFPSLALVVTICRLLVILT